MNKCRGAAHLFGILVLLTIVGILWLMFNQRPQQIDLRPQVDLLKQRVDLLEGRIRFLEQHLEVAPSK